MKYWVVIRGHETITSSDIKYVKNLVVEPGVILKRFNNEEEMTLYHKAVIPSPKKLLPLRLSDKVTVKINVNITAQTYELIVSYSNGQIQSIVNKIDTELIGDVVAKANRAELYAIYAASHVVTSNNVTIISTNNYAITCLNFYGPKWEAAGWPPGITNCDIIAAIYSAKQGRSITYRL